MLLHVITLAALVTQDRKIYSSVNHNPNSPETPVKNHLVNISPEALNEETLSYEQAVSAQPIQLMYDYS